MLAKFDVIVLNLDWRGVPNYVAYSWIDNSRVAARHRAQAELSAPRRKSSWQAIVRAKIEGQAANLGRFGRLDAKALDVLSSKVKSGDPDNLEAVAAKRYWHQMFDDPSFVREPMAGDRVNAMLNYGYAVIRGFVIQAVTLAGLWPTLGVWHRNRSNTFCLVDALIEPFRPAVDYAVRTMPSEASLDDPAAKEALVQTLSLPFAARGSTVATSIYEIAQSFALFVEGTEARFRVPHWIPPEPADG